MAALKLLNVKKQNVKIDPKSSAGKTNALDRSLRAKMYDLRMYKNNDSNKISGVLDTSLRGKMYDLRMYNVNKSKQVDKTIKATCDGRKKSSASSSSLGMYMTSDFIFMAYSL